MGKEGGSLSLPEEEEEEEEKSQDAFIASMAELNCAMLKRVSSVLFFALMAAVSTWRAFGRPSLNSSGIGRVN